MFENIIEQAAVSQIQNDIKSGSLTQSMLFYGPSESGKGSAALELARVLSCEKDSPPVAEWKCTCVSCEKHRYLQNEDLLVLGKKRFYAEIAANANVFLRNPSQGTKLTFYRSLKKLQIRFSSYITEDDPKISKISSQLQSFDEKMNDLYSADIEKAEKTALEKNTASLLKEAQSLEEDGISANIPIGHIRRASYWCRLAPLGKRKMLIIENAENMRDEARNSLLKLLEEPPASVSIILTSQRKESIIPTILSRLRPYRFLNRSVNAEKDVLSRVFKIPADFNIDNATNAISSLRSSLITAYLDSFLPASAEKMLSLAEWFISLDFKNIDITQTVRGLLAKSNSFENDSFPRFLKICLDISCEKIRNTEGPEYITYYDLLKKYLNEALTATDILNQNITIALEALLYKLKTKMDKCYA